MTNDATLEDSIREILAPYLKANLDHHYSPMPQVVAAILSLVKGERAKMIDRIKLHKDNPNLDARSKKEANAMIDYILADLKEHPHE